MKRVLYKGQRFIVKQAGSYCAYCQGEITGLLYCQKFVLPSGHQVCLKHAQCVCAASQRRFELHIDFSH